MKSKVVYFTLVLFVCIFLASCADNSTTVVNNYFYNLDGRVVRDVKLDSMMKGKTYLSVYSQIYQFTSSRTYDLTATISMKNTSETERIYVTRADFYNAKGELDKSFLEGTIYIDPLETVEIVINESNKEGGTGANFIFEWASPSKTNEPFFESVMISTSGQQGLSFTSTGKRIE